MKTLKLVTFITLLFTFMAVVRCSDNKNTTPAPTLADLTGVVNYPSTSGTATPAVNATVTLLTPASTVLVTMTDNTGKFSFLNLEGGSYSLSSSYYAVPTNTGGRLDGLNFETAADVPVTVASADLPQNLDLVNTGQTGTSIEAIDINYAWDNGTSAYVNATLWKYDGTHSPIAFDFPYRGQEAEFVGAFAQLSKHFDSTEIVELTTVAAFRGLMNRFMDSLAIELEGPELQARGGKAGASPADLHAYIEKLVAMG